MSAMVRIEPEFTRSSFDGNYWLGHCVGFRVECQDKRVGVVENVRFESRIDRPDELIVRCRGLLGRELVIEVDEVAVIVPSEMRLRIKHRPQPAAQGKPRRWHVYA
jgi:hypothetical protein